MENRILVKNIEGVGHIKLDNNYGLNGRKMYFLYEDNGRFIRAEESLSWLENLLSLMGKLDKKLIIEFENGEIPQKPWQLSEIEGCVKFWNKEGEKCYIQNSKHEGEPFEDWILGAINGDVKSMIDGCTRDNNDVAEYEMGKGGNHVWVHRKSDNARIIFIHF